jgi:hypothetical protein
MLSVVHSIPDERLSNPTNSIEVLISRIREVGREIAELQLLVIDLNKSVSDQRRSLEAVGRSSPLQTSATTGDASECRSTWL